MHFEGSARCKLVDPSKRRVKNVGSCRGICLRARSLGEVAGGGGYLPEVIRVAGTLRWRLTAAPLTRCVLASSPTILWLLRSLQSSTRPCAGQNGERASGVMLVAGVLSSRQPWQGGFRWLVISVSTQARVRTKQTRANICQYEQTYANLLLSSVVSCGILNVGSKWLRRVSASSDCFSSYCRNNYNETVTIPNT
jgi:hypothetical protein